MAEDFDTATIVAHQPASPPCRWHEEMTAAGWNFVDGSYRKTGRAFIPGEGPVSFPCDIDAKLLDALDDPIYFAGEQMRRFAAEVERPIGLTGDSQIGDFAVPPPFAGELHNAWLVRIATEFQSWGNRKFAEIDERVNLALAKAGQSD